MGGNYREYRTMAFEIAEQKMRIESNLVWWENRDRQVTNDTCGYEYDID